MSGISLYIPFVFKSIRRKHIISTFNLLELGRIERIDLIPSNTSHKQAFVHMCDLNDNKYPQILSRLNKGEKIKIVYDDPWFWRVSKSYSPKPTSKIPQWTCIIYEDGTSSRYEMPKKKIGLSPPEKFK